MTDEEEILSIAVRSEDAQRIRERFGTERFVMLVPEFMLDDIMQVIRHRLNEPDTADRRHGVYDVPMRLLREDEFPTIRYTVHGVSDDDLG